MIPLQDELNTRLSDRANRVTYQSFKMYLGKGIDDFLERPVGPGQMWATQNLQAGIEEFGADDGSPSENVHIEQVREAMDKMSAVPALAAGLLGGKLGNLTSAAALKVVLSGLLARTARKRMTFGAALASLAEMTLDWMDRTGVLSTAPEDRGIEIHWLRQLDQCCGADSQVFNTTVWKCCTPVEAGTAEALTLVQTSEYGIAGNFRV